MSALYQGPHRRNFARLVRMEGVKLEVEMSRPHKAQGHLPLRERLRQLQWERGLRPNRFRRWRK